MTWSPAARALTAGCSRPRPGCQGRRAPPISAPFGEVAAGDERPVCALVLLPECGELGECAGCAGVAGHGVRMREPGQPPEAADSAGTEQVTGSGRGFDQCDRFGGGDRDRTGGRRAPLTWAPLLGPGRTGAAAARAGD